VTVTLPETPTVEAIPFDAIDRDAEDPFAATESRPAARLDLLYAPGSSDRSVFAVPLEGAS